MACFWPWTGTAEFWPPAPPSAISPPSRAISAGTPAGSPGLGWVTVQIDYLRSNNVDRVTWRLNNGLTNPILAQYTNTTPFTSGDILLGYDDVFNSLGDTNDFAVMEMLSSRRS